MTLSSDRIVPGIPVPESFYDNYVCVTLSELAVTSRMSAAQVRESIARDNASGRTYLAIFRRLSDGEEMVAGYVFD